MPVILATEDAEIKRITVPGQPGKKVLKTLPQPIIGFRCACHPSHRRKHKIGGSWSRPGWAKNKTLSPK
jgi:hypothetical protein